jgi:hypothetical protein
MLRVFIRHVDYDNLVLEEGVRLFVAEQSVAPAGQSGGAAKVIQGFVLVDPLWRDGKVTGYVISLNRMRRDGHHGEGGRCEGWAGRVGWTREQLVGDGGGLLWTAGRLVSFHSAPLTFAKPIKRV